MVGTFISKYLLVTTSTITVTSSAAVTFFVAKHLKVGRNHWMAMEYVKEQYRLSMENKLSFENGIGGLETEILKVLSKISKCNDDADIVKNGKVSSCYKDETKDFSKKAQNFLHLLEVHRKKLDKSLNIEGLKTILGNEIDGIDVYK